MKKLLIFFSVSISIFSKGIENIRRSVVKIIVSSKYYDYENPWLSPQINFCSGSGFIVEDGLIVTNAHVVADGAFVQVQKAGDSKRYNAIVLKTSHECDLSLLKVEEKEFYKNTESLKINENLDLGQELYVYGFPRGGSELSLTKGISSRLEVTEYVHSGLKLLTCQIDAAINSGNSGGPVVSKGEVVGVAFQGWVGYQGLGYIIPSEVLTRFIKGYKGNRNINFPALGIYTQSMENSSLKDNFKASEELTGVLINKIAFKSPAKGILKEQDIITKIGKHNISNDGTFILRNGERLSMSYLISKEYIESYIDVELLREGKIINRKIKLDKSTDDIKVLGNMVYDKKPTYYIKAGLVFQPLQRNLAGYMGRFSGSITESGLLNKDISKDLEEVVLLTKVLPEEINKGYHYCYNEIITHLNGTKIRNFKHFVNLLENCNKKYYEIITKDKFKIVIDREEAEKVNKLILEKYNIEKDRSLE